MNRVEVTRTPDVAPAPLPLDDAHAAVLTVISSMGLVDRSALTSVVINATPLIAALVAAVCIVGRKVDRRDGTKATLYCMQPKGTAALTEHTSRIASTSPGTRAVPAVAGKRNQFSAEIYMGHELRRLCNRPGAYDAMAIPSLINRRERTLLQPSPTQEFSA